MPISAPRRLHAGYIGASPPRRQPFRYGQAPRAARGGVAAGRAAGPLLRERAAAATQRALAVAGRRTDVPDGGSSECAVDFPATRRVRAPREGSTLPPEPQPRVPSHGRRSRQTAAAAAAAERKAGRAFSAHAHRIAYARPAAHSEARSSAAVLRGAAADALALRCRVHSSCAAAAASQPPPLPFRPSAAAAHRAAAALQHRHQRRRCARTDERAEQPRWRRFAAVHPHVARPAPVARRPMRHPSRVQRGHTAAALCSSSCMLERRGGRTHRVAV